MREVALDLVLEDQVGDEALRLVQVDVLHLHELERLQVGRDGDLVHLHQQSPVETPTHSLAQSTSFLCRQVRSSIDVKM